jgi:hypothetical protein
VKDFELPEDKEERNVYLKEFKERIKKNENIRGIKNEVVELCNKFPLYPDFDVLR